MDHRSNDPVFIPAREVERGETSPLGVAGTPIEGRAAWFPWALAGLVLAVAATARRRVAPAFRLTALRLTALVIALAAAVLALGT